MTELRTRRPTGNIAWPVILVEGLHKKGKSKTAYDLSGSDLIGRTFAFELGERTADEYARLGDFEIVEHNGTHGDFFAQIKAATAIPAEDGKPNAIIIDSGSMLWDLHKQRADAKAKSTKRARETLAADPDAEIETQMSQWTAVKEDLWEVINHLKAWNGITIITARAEIVTKVVNGRPVPGQTERSLQIEKGIPYGVTGILRVDYPNPPMLMGVQSLDVQIPDDDGLEMPIENTLEHLVFRLLGAGGQFKSGIIVNPALGIPAREAKIALLDRAKQLVANAETGEFDLEEAKALAGKCWAGAGLGDEGEITTDQFEAVMACIEPEPDAAPPVEAEDESQVASEAEESESAEDTPDVADSPATPEQDPETPQEEPPAEAEPTTETPVEVTPDDPEVVSVSRSDAMEVLNTIASTIASTPTAAEMLVSNVWIEAGHGTAASITEDELEALIEALQAQDEGSPVDGASDVAEGPETPQEAPAEADPAPPATKARKVGKPAAAPAQGSLIS